MLVIDGDMSSSMRSLQSPVVHPTLDIVDSPVKTPGLERDIAESAATVSSRLHISSNTSAHRPARGSSEVYDVLDGAASVRDDYADNDCNGDELSQSTDGSPALADETHEHSHAPEGIHCPKAFSHIEANNGPDQSCDATEGDHTAGTQITVDQTWPGLCKEVLGSLTDCSLYSAAGLDEPLNNPEVESTFFTILAKQVRAIASRSILTLVPRTISSLTIFSRTASMMAS
ncbi:hypothetical protein AAFC00_004210 [Neodothiora populina]